MTKTADRSGVCYAFSNQIGNGFAIQSTQRSKIAEQFEETIAIEGGDLRKAAWCCPGFCVAEAVGDERLGEPKRGQPKESKRKTAIDHRMMNDGVR